MDENHIIAFLGIATILSFYMGMAARKFKLPSLIGYMVLGIILGPSLTGFFTKDAIENLSFLNEIILGIVAFSIGAELNLRMLKKLGYGIASIIFAESFMAFLFVLVGVYAVTRDLPTALVFGAMAPASAPAGTVAVIQEYKARGSLTQALYAVVGFDDGLAIIIFGFAFAFAKSILFAEVTGNHAGLIKNILIPFKEILLSMIIGVVLGFVFSQIVRFIKNARDFVIMIFGIIFIATGMSNLLHCSLILSNMMIGFLLVNTRKDSVVRNVLTPLTDIMPLLFIWFFFLAGVHLNIKELLYLGTIGIVYIITRSAGLISGAYLGGVIGKVEDKIKKLIGLGILSQAGVAIGLSLMVKQELAEISSSHAQSIGESVIVIVTATSIVFEIIGPILTKYALKKAGEIREDG